VCLSLRRRDHLTSPSCPDCKAVRSCAELFHYYSIANWVRAIYSEAKVGEQLTSWPRGQADEYVKEDMIDGEKFNDLVGCRHDSIR
jgi:hypothetical protein